jgi:hypothetical protein
MVFSLLAIVNFGHGQSAKFSVLLGLYTAEARQERTQLRRRGIVVIAFRRSRDLIEQFSLRIDS